MSVVATTTTLVLASMFAPVGLAAAQPGNAPPAAAVALSPSQTPASPSQTPASPSSIEPAAPPASSSSELSPATATVLSVGGTLASWVIFGVGVSAKNEAAGWIGFAGTLVAPSFGHWYAHSSGLGGIGLRAVGAATVVGGAVLAFSECSLFGPCNGSDHAGVAVAVAGGVLFLGATIYDFATVGRDAAQYNERARQISLAPLIRPDDHGLGLAVVGRF